MGVALGICSKAQAQSLATIDLTPRAEVAVVFSFPTEFKAVSGVTELLRVSSAIAKHQGYFSLSEVPAFAIEACRKRYQNAGDYTCFVKAARPDHKEHWGEAPKPEDSSQWVEFWRTKSPEAPRYILVLTASSKEGQDSLGADIIYVEDAFKALHMMRNFPELSVEVFDQVEEAVTSAPTVKEVAPVTINDLSGAENYLRRVLRREILGRGELKRLQGKLGAVEFEIPVDGAELLHQEKLLAAPRLGKLLVRGIKVGANTFLLRKKGFVPQELEIDVLEGKTIPAKFKLLREGEFTTEEQRNVVLWSSLGVVAAGAVVAGIGHCYGEIDAGVAIGDSGGKNQFLRFGPSEAMGGVPASQGSGPLVIPLGYSLVAAGALSAGGIFFEDSDDFPWWQIITGLAVGAVAYGAFEIHDATQ